MLGLTLLVVNLLGVATGPYVAGLIGDRAGLTAGLSWSLVPAAAGLVLVARAGLREGVRS